MTGDVLLDIYAKIFGSAVLIAPEYLLVTLFIAYVLFKLRGAGGSFWSWVMPREIYLHRSHMLDLKLFALGRVLTILTVANKIALTSYSSAWVSGLFSAEEALASLNPWVVAAVLFVVNDFILYWIHRIYHSTPQLWPIHAVHHSAEVLTPVTAYRQHPLSDVIGLLVTTAAFGVVQGLFLGVFAQEASGTLIAGVNAFFFLFAMLTANFRHSHIWISFGPVLEHLLISPAQHQIHHSIAPEHHNKNFGENFAIWDWAFGSLYVPKQRETLVVGIADTEDANAPVTPYPTLWQTLWRPVHEIAETFRAKP